MFYIYENIKFENNSEYCLYLNVNVNSTVVNSAKAYCFLVLFVFRES